MSAIATQLRDKLERIGKIKRDTLALDTRHFLELDPGVRLATTLLHCDAHLEAFGAGWDQIVDLESEVAVWNRVRRRLAGRG